MKQVRCRSNSHATDQRTRSALHQPTYTILQQPTRNILQQPTCNMLQQPTGDRLPYSAVWQNEKNVWRKFERACKVARSGHDVASLLSWLALQVSYRRNPLHKLSPLLTLNPLQLYPFQLPLPPLSWHVWCLVCQLLWTLDTLGGRVAMKELARGVLAGCLQARLHV